MLLNISIKFMPSIFFTSLNRTNPKLFESCPFSLGHKHLPKLQVIGLLSPITYPFPAILILLLSFSIGSTCSGSSPLPSIGVSPTSPFLSFPFTQPDINKCSDDRTGVQAVGSWWSNDEGEGRTNTSGVQAARSLVGEDRPPSSTLLMTDGVLAVVFSLGK
ncbi:hypothetical protein L1987_32504 [Smallanthus sonchifolius]|uniref:Uncharacterized protein n=1 Tax=Smallanthus sonchifolius TaxID=185202 RepID=A0ACB9HN75_9ASTR|nr:hypothetical protein L1987_32504 [Smallanthus sonchifolius]